MQMDGILDRHGRNGENCAEADADRSQQQFDER